jgi:dienelactone hydrolase
MRTLRRLAIPQTALLGLTAPRALPLGDMGFSWLHTFQADGAQVPSTDPRRLRSLEECCAALALLLSAIVQPAEVPTSGAPVDDGQGEGRARATATGASGGRWRAEHVFLLGFSQGAMVAFRSALTGAHRLGGAIAVSGMLLREDPLCARATMYAALAGKRGGREGFTPLLLSHGARDHTIPLARMRSQVRTLRWAFGSAYGAADGPLPAEVDVREYSEKAHSFFASEPEVRDALSFLADRMRLRSLQLEQRDDVVLLQ